TSILIHKDVAFIEQGKLVDPQGRFIILTGLFNNAQYTLVSTYFPNTGAEVFLRRLMQKIEQHKLGGLILCGDFNFITSPEEDTTAVPQGVRRRQMVSTCKQLNAKLTLHNLYDSWR
ncbi:Hypothetical predicted protein, partial [Pelobates cultripes]